MKPACKLLFTVAAWAPVAVAAQNLSNPCYGHLHKAFYAATGDGARAALQAFQNEGCARYLEQKYPLGIVPQSQPSIDALAYMLHERIRAAPVSTASGAAGITSGSILGGSTGGGGSGVMRPAPSSGGSAAGSVAPPGVRLPGGGGVTAVPQRATN